METEQSHRGLEKKAIETCIDLLNAAVADTIDLALITKQAHWNIKGREFIAIHEMLDELREDVDEYADTMAERVVQLGGISLGTVQAVAKATRLEPYPTGISAIPDHLKALVSRFGKVSGTIRADIDKADKAGDADTADIFTEVSRGLDKWIWFLEAHLKH